MSQLDGIDPEIYRTIVFPKLAERIVASNDELAQQYLCEIVVQVKCVFRIRYSFSKVFPDEFHLATLDTFLLMVESLVPSVDCKAIVVVFLERLTKFIVANPGVVPQETNIFNLFYSFIQEFTQVSVYSV